MKGLRLDPDALSVDAFAVEAAREAEGTVLGFGGAVTKNQGSCLDPTASKQCPDCM